MPPSGAHDVPATFGSSRPEHYVPANNCKAEPLRVQSGGRSAVSFLPCSCTTASHRVQAAIWSSARLWAEAPAAVVIPRCSGAVQPTKIDGCQIRRASLHIEAAALSPEVPSRGALAGAAAALLTGVRDGPAQRPTSGRRAYRPAAPDPNLTPLFIGQPEQPCPPHLL